MTTVLNRQPPSAAQSPAQVLERADQSLTKVATVEARREAGEGLSPATPSPTGGDAALEVAAVGYEAQLGAAQAHEARDARTQNGHDEALIEAHDAGQDLTLPEDEPRRSVVPVEVVVLPFVMGLELLLLPGPLATTFDLSDGSLLPYLMAALLALMGAGAAHRFGHHWPQRNALRPGDRRTSRNGLAFWGSLVGAIGAVAVAMRLNIENQDSLANYGLGIDPFGITTYIVVQVIVVVVALGLGACFGTRVAAAARLSVEDWIARLRTDVDGRQHLLDDDPVEHQRQQQQLRTAHQRHWVSYRNLLAAKHPSVAGRVAWADRNAVDFAAAGITDAGVGGGDPQAPGDGAEPGPEGPGADPAGGPSPQGRAPVPQPGAAPGPASEGHDAPEDPGPRPAPPSGGPAGSASTGQPSSAAGGPQPGRTPRPQSDADLIDEIFGDPSAA